MARNVLVLMAISSYKCQILLSYKRKTLQEENQKILNLDEGDNPGGRDAELEALAAGREIA
jgi:hypothetical protein